MNFAEKMEQANRKILFIAWDNPRSNYLEGLFVPIFEGLSKKFSYEFHIIQFSWADQERINFLTRYCADRGMRYTHIKIITRPVATLGKFITVWRSSSVLLRYIKEHDIRVVMPRSTMPAEMALAVKRKLPKLKIIFDADGLPIEERVDFAGLKRGSMRYTQLKKIERNIVDQADVVITRTYQATTFLLDQYQADPGKFFVVVNGRDEDFFSRRDHQRTLLREKLNIPLNAVVLTYCGSLGPQYGVGEMLKIHRRLAAENNNYYFLVITNNPAYLDSEIVETDVKIRVEKVNFSEIPDYLSAGDVAFAIRKKSFSMRGVAPIKIAEYLLMGLPVVASSGIGDTDALLSDKEFIFILKDYSDAELNEAVNWINGLESGSPVNQDARNFGRKQFSLQKSVESYQGALKNLFI